MADELKTIRQLKPVERMVSYGTPEEPDRREQLRRGLLTFSNFLGMDLRTSTQRFVSEWNSRVFENSVDTECSRKLDVLSRRLDISRVNLKQLECEVAQADSDHFAALSGDSEADLATTRAICLKKASDLAFCKDETAILERLCTDAQRAYEQEQSDKYPEFQADVMRYARNEQAAAVDTLIRIVEGEEFTQAIQTLCRTVFLARMSEQSVNRFVKNLNAVISSGELAGPGA